MKTSKNEIISRHNEIINYLRKNNCVEISVLADMFHVSDTTMRRDIHLLSKHGEAIRCKNNICMLDVGKSHPTFDDERGSFACSNEKEKIAQRAAALIEDGDTVFFNSSSTVLRIIPYIKNKSVTIVTNNGRSLFIDRDSNIDLVLIGGEVIGNTKIANAKMYTAGLTSMAIQDPAVNQAMIQQCQGPVIVVADHRKVKIQHSFFFCSLSKISCLITDSESDAEELDNIRQNGVV